MNRKTLILTLLIGLVLASLAGAHLISPLTPDTQVDSLGENAAAADDSLEFTFSFKVKIRLPMLKKDAV